MTVPRTQLLVLNSSNAFSSTSSAEKTWIFEPIYPLPGNLLRVSLESFRIMHVFKNIPTTAYVEAGRTNSSTITVSVPPGNYTPTSLAQVLTTALTPIGVVISYDANNLVYNFTPSIYVGNGTTIFRQLGFVEKGQYVQSTVPVDLDNLTAFHIHMESNSVSGLLGFTPFDTRYGFRYQYQAGNDTRFAYVAGSINKITIKLCDQDNVPLADKYIVNSYNEKARLNYIPEWHVALILEEIPAKNVLPTC